MRNLLISTVFLALASLAGGCVYQPSMSQGNLLKQEDIDRLEIGMTRWVTIIFDGDTVAEIRKDQKLEPDV